ncbi:hypothetical protein PoB_004427100 [Plakobranchus ocellatus]|uniref:Secreted protein n=1 Tax=Plakobranchus ocellatus TaxID=259542 RepID=A0AAV4BBH1_9GAST|nr:hypothetical protein PoB_004427100 [Plakobranchus ocellatus]
MPFESLSLVSGSLLYVHIVVILHSAPGSLRHAENGAANTKCCILAPHDTDIEVATSHCTACNQHQRLPPKQPSHLGINQDKPWSHGHIHQVINHRDHYRTIQGPTAQQKDKCIYLCFPSRSQSCLLRSPFNNDSTSRCRRAIVAILVSS